MSDPFRADIARRIWDTKYRFREPGGVRDATIEDSWRRIARALASVEAARVRAAWEKRFYEVLEGFRFLPGGRIQAGAGTGHRVTLFNCFVMGLIEDSMDGIFDALKEGALTMQQGGGVGYDFSTLRPRGAPALGVGVVASGPLSFMEIWDSMCSTILSTGARRGAMMATLRCDHPDILEFVRAKRDPARLRRFNLSVLVSDEFMRAVQAGGAWELAFPGGDGSGESVARRWSGSDEPVPCRVHRRLPARDLWDEIVRSTYEYAEPGVIFVDRVNEWNNLWYAERISATNPCGELPLPPYGACDLGSINLTQFVRAPFTPKAAMDLEALAVTATVAVRMLDNVTDLSRFPLERQRQAAHAARRVGLGITGLGDALIMLGLDYRAEAGRAAAASFMRTICHSAYAASVELAHEKGVFPRYDRERYLEGRFIAALPAELRRAIGHRGIRNSHLTAIAPTGTISLLANNVSSGLEPVYRSEYGRRVRELDGSFSEHAVTDHAVDLYRAQSGASALPPAFVTATEVSPREHLDMQAALQPYVDSAISKTVNVPRDFPFESFRSLYDEAYERGLKGCTTFRPNPVTGQVLVDVEDKGPASHCCSVEREAD